MANASRIAVTFLQFYPDTKLRACWACFFLFTFAVMD